MFIRFFAVLKKEFLQIRKMPALVPIILAIPILQIIVFSFAAVLDTKNITVGIIDRDRTYTSREFVLKLKNSGYFSFDDSISKESEVGEYFQKNKIVACAVIPVNFEKNLKKYGTSSIQVLADGSNATVAQAASLYMTAAADSFSIGNNNFDIAVRFLFNPSGENKFFFIPGVFAMILIVIGMPLTAISLVKEKEQGTFEQMNVTPIKSYEVIFGKLIPYMILIFVSSTIMLFVSFLVFKMPFRGSFFTFYAALLCFLFVALGCGIFVSIISQTQQQAILTSFFILLPMMLFSGFMFPVENMSGIFGAMAEINPMTHFLRIIRDVFLKGSPAVYHFDAFKKIILSDIVIFAISVSLFSKRNS